MVSTSAVWERVRACVERSRWGDIKARLPLRADGVGEPDEPVDEWSCDARKKKRGGEADEAAGENIDG
jgi:hypothetical protein